MSSVHKCIFELEKNINDEQEVVADNNTMLFSVIIKISSVEHLKQILDQMLKSSPQLTKQQSERPAGGFFSGTIIFKRLWAGLRARLVPLLFQCFYARRFFTRLAPAMIGITHNGECAFYEFVADYERQQ